MPTLNDFIGQLKDPVFRQNVLYQFSLITPGDWNAVATWITNAGYPCTAAEVTAAAHANPGFFQDAGRFPDLGWNRRQTLA